MKQFINKIHLWLGLATAPIIIFICITGCLIVFADEIIEYSAGEAKYVPEIKANKLPMEDILAKLKETFPDGRKPFYIIAYKDSARSVRCNMYSPGEGLRMVYIDPYTGKVLKDDSTIHFFFVTAHLHATLLMHKTGEWIIDIAVLLFVILLITGMVLWWPKSWSKKHRDGAFKVKWNANGKRLNRDLHNVMGFYGIVILLMLSITGLTIAFKPLGALTQKTFGGDPTKSFEKRFPVMDTLNITSSYPINSIMDATFTKYPDKEEVMFYSYLLDRSGYYKLIAASKIGLKSMYNVDVAFYNRYTGEELTLSEKDRNTEIIENTYWSLHMGTYWGILGKIITLIGGLLGASLPITGFIMWRHRTAKKTQINIELL